MDISLNEKARGWQEAARKFTQEELIPWEIEAEFSAGEIPAEESKKHHQMAVELGFSKMDVPLAYGGLALGMTVQVAVWEQLGRVTNALCWCFSEAQQWMFEACSEAQIEKFIIPLIDGSRKECYAITEAEAGSNETVNTSATECDGGYLINGDKWYVTSANLADYFFLQAKLDNGEHALFFLDIDSPGVEVIANPLFSHTYAAHHPTYRFTNVFIAKENRIGEEGDGMQYTRSWFRHERMMIAARCCGAAARLIEEASEFALNRNIDGETLADKQVIQMMLADSATELWAARLMTFEAAEAHDRGDDLKQLHARCSMAKLYASEMANRVADRAVQIFGGRGYMRENLAERYYRELRVDRIWEGTSEIQRLIIANSLLKRGLSGM
ncbi:MAG: acyl-CoA dehydrogenase [Gammaproteobacteria bacterium]|nr:acyl-CoA dehydrogenase [Gammaproteobacteria bacterium]